MTTKKTKPILQTLCELPPADEASKNQFSDSFSSVNGLHKLSWPSALPNPGKFIDFGDTPLSSSVNSTTLTETQKAADWANSPIVPSIHAPKLPTRPHGSPFCDSTSDLGLKLPDATKNIHIDEAQTPLSDSLYVGSFPPPPPPPMYKTTANGEQICTQSELVKAWDRWYKVTEKWWTTFPNYPPPPRHPNEMPDKPYSLEQWYRRVDFWWSYMQTMYFSPGHAHDLPAPQYVTSILDRACVGT
mmetsp:Transcript_16157/g.25144  ORF Transcript_16157/g.25144 Transcript_16157/m.25144 type:complete len:244 (-) Transcript_16157:155-886(-)